MIISSYASLAITKKVFNLESSLSNKNTWVIIFVWFVPVIWFFLSLYFYYKFVKKNWGAFFVKFLLSFIVYFIFYLILSVIIALLLRSIVLPFQVSGSAMNPNFIDKEFVLINKLWSNYDRGDVVIFNTHIKWREYFIKRIIWLPWETLKIQSGAVFVKEAWSEKFIEIYEKYLMEWNSKTTFVMWDNWEKIYKIPENSYFVMWDNRNSSTDSRNCFSNCEFWDRTNYITKEDIIWATFFSKK